MEWRQHAHKGINGGAAHGNTKNQACLGQEWAEPSRTHNGTRPSISVPWCERRQHPAVRHAVVAAASYCSKADHAVGPEENGTVPHSTRTYPLTLWAPERLQQPTGSARTFSLRATSVSAAPCRSLSSHSVDRVCMASVTAACSDTGGGGGARGPPKGNKDVDQRGGPREWLWEPLRAALQCTHLCGLKVSDLLLTLLHTTSFVKETEQGKLLLKHQRVQDIGSC